MNTRRQAPDAGYSWRKWQAHYPERQPFPWLYALNVWAWSAVLGAIIGVVVVR